MLMSVVSGGKIICWGEWPFLYGNICQNCYKCEWHILWNRSVPFFLWLIIKSGSCGLLLVVLWFPPILYCKIVILCKGIVMSWLSRTSTVSRCTIAKNGSHCWVIQIIHLNDPTEDKASWWILFKLVSTKKKKRTNKMKQQSERPKVGWLVSFDLGDICGILCF